MRVRILIHNQPDVTLSTPHSRMTKSKLVAVLQVCKMIWYWRTQSFSSTLLLLWIEFGDSMRGLWWWWCLCVLFVLVFLFSYHRHTLGLPCQVRRITFGSGRKNERRLKTLKNILSYSMSDTSIGKCANGKVKPQSASRLSFTRLYQLKISSLVQTGWSEKRPQTTSHWVHLQLSLYPHPCHRAARLPFLRMAPQGGCQSLSWASRLPLRHFLE